MLFTVYAYTYNEYKMPVLTVHFFSRQSEIAT